MDALPTLSHETPPQPITEEVKQRLIDLVERGDVYGLMLRSVMLWVTAYHPEFGHPCIVAPVGRGRPDAIIPLTLPERPSLPPSLPTS